MKYFLINYKLVCVGPTNRLQPKLCGACVWHAFERFVEVISFKQGR